LDVGGEHLIPLEHTPREVHGYWLTGHAMRRCYKRLDLNIDNHPSNAHKPV
jgi:hypothetical protein